MEPQYVDLSEDDDDEAPEEVTFEDSKATALRSMKQAIDSVRREKELLKEKRKKRQELFQEQKKRKLLPDDILEEIDSAVPKKPKVSEVEAEKESGEEASSSVVEESEGSDDDDLVVEEKGKEKRRRRYKRRSLKGNCSVMRVQDQSLANKQQQSALKFIQSRLYGKGTNRTTASQLLSLENKRALNKTAAVQFVDKQWGLERKEKAKKFKKIWKTKQGSGRD
ncbi:hypothetical protein JZ751_000733 [Albula glossodonta]|uniref:U3 small nucleolar RNA-associated protein NOL7 C-terminal domain-containing protein n=1 Tax=Albula glossodonta TaxID=121402 RepID=A0A8T2PWX0_9TELE|nr:hypothetical protein JZ751_000733 [Albula glossodonta]